MFLIFIINLALASDLKTVSEVDFTQYQGTWYELAAIPAEFQAQCAINTKAEYELNQDSTISVTNSCVKADGQLDIANGLGRINPEFNEPGKLEVTFAKAQNWIWQAAGDYWIMEIGANYEYVLVGHPDRSYGWILAREQKQSKSFYQQAEKVFAANGYDTCKILISNTDEQKFENRPPLCEFTK